jgi:stage II sporulation protein D
MKNKNGKPGKIAIFLLFLIVFGIFAYGIHFKQQIKNSENTEAYNTGDGNMEDIYYQLSEYTEAYVKNILNKDKAVEVSVSEAALTYKNIRVLISNAGGYNHSDVIFTCDTDFSVGYGDKILCYEAGEVVDVNEIAEAQTAELIRIDSNSEAGRIQLLSVEKECGNPKYRGTVYIKPVNTSSKGSGDASYNVVNELPLEKYLYAVVSSEMPSSYEEEALKAQAVCARGYALRKINEGAYEDYDADIDDTTSCQVYNNIAETEASINAVNETAGMVAVYNGELIETYFYSTSCGTTCSNTEVWSGESLPYLNSSLELSMETDVETGANSKEQSVMSYNSSRALSADGTTLSSEDLFRDFIDNKIYTDTVEQKLPMYRWVVKYTSEQMKETLSTSLENIITANPDRVSVAYSDQVSSKENADAASLIQKGDLSTYLDNMENISVTKRGDSGIALDVTLHCSEMDITVSNQYFIRQLFSPELTTIATQEGSTLTGWTMLPSAYFYIEKNEDNSYTLSGGGFGHGVGMSQNGANELAGEGYGYEEILQYYFQGIEVEAVEQEK